MFICSFGSAPSTSPPFSILWGSTNSKHKKSYFFLCDMNSQPFKDNKKRQCSGSLQPQTKQKITKHITHDGSMYAIYGNINIPQSCKHIYYTWILWVMGNDNVQGFLADPLTSQTSRTSLHLGLPDHFFLGSAFPGFPKCALHKTSWKLYLSSVKNPQASKIIRELHRGFRHRSFVLFVLFLDSQCLSWYVMIRPSDCLALQCIDCVLLSKLFVFRRKCKLFLKKCMFKHKTSH